MLEDILDTKIKIRIVKLFAGKNEALQVSDVARVLKISKSRASECLKELAKRGMLESRAVGRSILYKPTSNVLAKAVYKFIAQENSLLDEIKQDVLKEVKKFKPVSLVLFGSSLKGLKIAGDVDFLLLHVDKIEREKIYEIIGRLSEKFRFRISILLMSVKEFQTKAKNGEEFILNVLANNELLYGKDLESVVWQEK